MSAGLRDRVAGRLAVLLSNPRHAFLLRSEDKELAMSAASNKVRVGILGASGYTGAELIRLLAHHPGADMRLLTADRHAGQALGAVFPHLGHLGLPKLIKIDEANWDAVDLVFCGLPHGTTQEVIAKLPTRLKVIDLSADFRLAAIETYATWYRPPHPAPHLHKTPPYPPPHIHH